MDVCLLFPDPMAEYRAPPPQALERMARLLGPGLRVAAALHRSVHEVHYVDFIGGRDCERALRRLRRGQGGPPPLDWQRVRDFAWQAPLRALLWCHPAPAGVLQPPQWLLGHGVHAVVGGVRERWDP